MGQATEDLHHARTNLRIEVLKQLLLLTDEVVADTGAQVAALSSSTQRDRTTVLRVRSLLDVPLLYKRGHDATRCALVHEQPLC
jgi:hypothetical protein